MLDRLIIKIILSGVIVITSCYYDVEENLYPGKICITSNLSYEININPILQRNCYVCHSPGQSISNVTLEGYDELMVYVINGKLLGSIRHASGFKPMPQGASKLSDCDIARIEQWIINGSPY